MFAIVFHQLAAIGLADWIAIISGVAYSLLAMRRSRWCWASGALSSCVLVYVAFRSRLPMQSALQIFYIAMSCYGFWRWSRVGNDRVIRISRFPLSWHLCMIAACAVSAWFSGSLLLAFTQAAWPRLDMLVMLGSLLTTWMTAHGKLENWAYWIVIDSASMFLYFVQGASGAALLYLLYTGIAVAGARNWARAYRLQEQVATA